MLAFFPSSVVVHLPMTLLPNTSVSLLRLCGTGSKWNSIGGCCPDIAGNYRGGQLPFSFLDAESAHPHGCRMARRRTAWACQNLNRP
jgi:hypothetical protein